VQETELKFQVPTAGSAALRRAVGTATAKTTRLQAVYADTAGHHLAAAGLALRLRKEGRVWVQTLKGRGDGLMQRLEHEVSLPAQRATPVIDPARHDGTPAGKVLRAALSAAGDGASETAELLPVYRTDIQRLHRRVRHEGAVIEIAHDKGRILVQHLADGQALVLPVDEIEFELKSGPATALTELAARWVARHGLWWDVRTKSERGFRLALGLEQVPATRAAKPPEPRAASDQSLPLAWAAMLRSALQHALPNLAELAGGCADAAQAAEHLHQLRVALRRLRTALVLFAPWGGDAAVGETALALEAEWRTVFTHLGVSRDADVLAATWLPRLAAVGGPSLDTGAVAEQQDVGAVVRQPEVTGLLLRTLALILSLQAAQAEPAAATSATAAGAAAASAPPAPATATATATAASAPAKLAPAAARVLRKAWQRAWADCKGFDAAPVEQQHRARKRLKRLRYALEFTQRAFPRKPVRQLQRRLAAALQVLGEVNDLQTARAHFEARALEDPRAWFAVGWLTAQQAPLLRAASRALRALKAVPKPWAKALFKGKPAG